MRFSLSGLLAAAAFVLAPALHAQGEQAPSSPSALEQRHAAARSPRAHREHAVVRVEGTWCGSGFLRGTQLDLVQHQQEFEGTLVRGERTRNVDGTIEGTTLRTSAASSGRAGELVLELQEDKLRIVTAGGPLRLIEGMSFFRATGTSCG